MYMIVILFPGSTTGEMIVRSCNVFLFADFVFLICCMSVMFVLTGGDL